MLRSSSATRCGRTAWEELHSLRETSGTDIVSHETNRVDDLDLDRLEALTGDAREAYLEGRNMDFAAAVAYALAGPD